MFCTFFLLKAALSQLFFVFTMVYVCNYPFFYAFSLYDSIFPQAVVIGIFTFLRRRIVVVALKPIIKVGARAAPTALGHFRR